ncbi:pS183L [African swine fever virus]|uniref:PS183L n=1 Tax=African swine fever virus TaxID=10497 RepID=A0A6G6AGP3_ASF|nr:pS183L [African swine fever virus]
MSVVVGGVEYSLNNWARYEIKRRAAELESVNYYPHCEYIMPEDIVVSILGSKPNCPFLEALKRFHDFLKKRRIIFKGEYLVIPWMGAQDVADMIHHVENRINLDHLEDLAHMLKLITYHKSFDTCINQAFEHLYAFKFPDANIETHDLKHIRQLEKKMYGYILRLEKLQTVLTFYIEFLLKQV